MNIKSKTNLKPTLTLFDATAMNIGAIIGAGIFVVTGIVSGLAGPSIIISMIMAAVISLFTALSFVELTKWLPAEGGVYMFARKLVSPFVGFLSGWMWIISNIFAGAAVAVGFAYYFVSLFPIFNFRIIAAVLSVAFTVINYLGIRRSAGFNNMLVSVKIIILLVFILVGLLHVKSANFTPFVQSVPGIFYGAFFIFFAYSGFARIAVVSEEVKDSRRVIPKAIILSLVVSTIIYILVSIVAVGLIGAQSLGESNSPLVKAIGVVGNPTLTLIVSIGGMFATASVLLTSNLGVSRMVFAMAREKDLPSALGKLHAKYNTPYLSIFAIGAVMTILTLLFDLSGVIAVSTFASLFYYAVANVSALRLKIKNRVYSKAIPILGLATCIALLFFVQQSSLFIGAICLVAGTIYYFGKKRQGQ